jgi:hypothetical protein
VKTFHSQTIWCNTADFVLTAPTNNILRNNQKEVIPIEKPSVEKKYLEFNNQHGFASWACLPS